MPYSSNKSHRRAPGAINPLRLTEHPYRARSDSTGTPGPARFFPICASSRRHLARSQWPMKCFSIMKKSAEMTPR